MKSIYSLFLRLCCMYLIGVSFRFYAYEHPGLEKMIIATNVRGVRATLSASRLTFQEKNRLLARANDMVIKRAMESEYTNDFSDAVMSRGFFGSIIAICSVPVLLGAPIVAVVESAQPFPCEKRIFTYACTTVVAAGIFTSGCLLARNGIRDIGPSVHSAAENHRRLLADAKEIKQIISCAYYAR